MAASSEAALYFPLVFFFAVAEFDPDRIFRQQLFDFFRPFYKDYVSRVGNGFFEIKYLQIAVMLETVAIDVVRILKALVADGVSFYENECRTRNLAPRAKRLQKTLNKRGFSGTEVSHEADNHGVRARP